ncbi:Release factor glutamine methyltransferase [Blastochloris viridis]|uniref:Release factor glutamine methyltransferase n=1 Tax=Blastochloris viridis TaxID=1079 RepID=A0A0S4Q643_BLAVI|nr:Release factor glutamine methyltransferase [Blastochloris viridis]
MRQALHAAGIAEADADARHLLAWALKCDASGLILAADRPLGTEAADALAALLARRLRREPMARLKGTREFWGLEFELSAETLVPRPDTETLVEAVLRARPERTAPLRIIDLGTGSGALLAALLAEYPRASGVATDRSRLALSTARTNLARHGFTARAAVVACDWGTALGGRFDVVVSNPPYIATADIAGLDPEVRVFDPAAALDGGADGLAAYRAILADLPRLLTPGGLAVLELGIGQAAAVANLAVAAGLVVREVAADLAGHPRALVATLQADLGAMLETNSPNSR